MTKYIYDILNWNPLNTNSFNLLTIVNIKPDIKLLNLFKIAPLNNILCKIHGTDSSYDNNYSYTRIDKSTEDDTYYITLDKIWKSYPMPEKYGKIEFLDQSVYKTIDYLTNPNASPIITPTELTTPNLNLLYNDTETNQEFDNNVVKPNDGIATNQFCSNPRMKLSDILIPIGISFILIGLLAYIFPKKVFK